MNRLGNESSLYLRQHADNPVHWHPWDDEALTLAREFDRPILLSIGYSACHWCHVMAHESFEDEATAALMNRYFVNIKIDREERPDLDRIYQLSHQLLTGRGGGWPLTVFLDPRAHAPFFAGTYFPLERRYGMPAFSEVLQGVHDWFHANREEVTEKSIQMQSAVQSIQQPATGSRLPGADDAQTLIQRASEQILQRHDAVNGGYGAAPKFPQAPILEAVALCGRLENGSQLHSSLRFTLQQMALSGLRDHLDGGFFRYCVDDSWTIPHFEKMLYDNAMLLPLYAEGASRWADPLLEEAATGIADWLVGVMRQEGGGYAASIDADADGEEGGFHVWTPRQLEAVLQQEDAALVRSVYGLDGPPNFEGHGWHLQWRRPLPAGSDLTPAETARLKAARAKLLGAREKRVHPALDDKRLTSWNALLASGLLRAARALDRVDWFEQAEQILDFIAEQLWDGERLQAVYNRGQARFAAYLDDHAWLLDALLLSLARQWNPGRLQFAIELAEALLRRFEDADSGGFYFSDADVEVPMARCMLFQDDATPSGNAGAIRALNRLGHLLGETRYLRAAGRCLARAMPAVGEAPLGHTSLLAALYEEVLPPAHLVIAGSDMQACLALKQWAERRDRVDCYLIDSEVAELPGVLQAYRSDEPVTAWLCRGTRCLPPAHSREALEKRFQELGQSE